MFRATQHSQVIRRSLFNIRISGDHSTPFAARRAPPCTLLQNNRLDFSSTDLTFVPKPVLTHPHRSFAVLRPSDHHSPSNTFPNARQASPYRKYEVLAPSCPHTNSLGLVKTEIGQRSGCLEDHLCCIYCTGHAEKSRH